MEERMNRSPLTGPRGYFVGAVVLVLVGLVVGIGLSTSLNLPARTSAEKAVLAAVSSSSAVPESPFVAVVDRALPAVVYIEVRRSGGSPDDQVDPFQRLFGEGQRRAPVRPSSGSGFIIDAQGHILTNNHVVRDANEISVTLNDKRNFKAKLVGADPETDVAIIKVEGKDLPVLPLGDSEKIRVGDWAIAIGNPLGELQGSVTAGIISAKGRSNLNIFGGTPGFQDFIQTDASINFGNSGGPLCNIRGEAIGVNTAINPSGQGIGFAIPINLARHVAEQLVAQGTVKRAMMGVLLAPLSPDIAEGLGLPSTDGVLIQTVFKDQPADRAGLKRNDVIVEFDGRPVADLQKFRLRVADTPVGTRVPMVVLREGKRVPVTILLADRDQNVLAQAQPTRPEAASETLAGLTVRGLTAEERRSAGIESGVMITKVAPGSAAEEADLSPDEVIEEVSTRPVNTPDQLEQALQEAQKDGKPAVLLVNTGNGTRFVALRLRK
jgi:Do/DeqQ family serine protease